MNQVESKERFPCLIACIGTFYVGFELIKESIKGLGKIAEENFSYLAASHKESQKIVKNVTKYSCDHLSILTNDTLVLPTELLSYSEPIIQQAYLDILVTSKSVTEIAENSLILVRKPVVECRSYLRPMTYESQKGCQQVASLAKQVLQPNDLLHELFRQKEIKELFSYFRASNSEMMKILNLSMQHIHFLTLKLFSLSIFSEEVFSYFSSTHEIRKITCDTCNSIKDLGKLLLHKVVHQTVKEFLAYSYPCLLENVKLVKNIVKLSGAFLLLLSRHSFAFLKEVSSVFSPALLQVSQSFDGIQKQMNKMRHLKTICDIPCEASNYISPACIELRKGKCKSQKSIDEVLSYTYFISKIFCEVKTYPLLTSSEIRKGVIRSQKAIAEVWPYTHSIHKIPKETCSYALPAFLEVQKSRRHMQKAILKVWSATYLTSKIVDESFNYAWPISLEMQKGLRKPQQVALQVCSYSQVVPAFYFEIASYALSNLCEIKKSGRISQEVISELWPYPYCFAKISCEASSYASPAILEMQKIAYKTHQSFLEIWPCIQYPVHAVLSELIDFLPTTFSETLKITSASKVFFSTILAQRPHYLTTLTLEILNYLIDGTDEFLKLFLYTACQTKETIEPISQNLFLLTQEFILYILSSFKEVSKTTIHAPKDLLAHFLMKPIYQILKQMCSYFSITCEKPLKEMQPALKVATQSINTSSIVYDSIVEGSLELASFLPASAKEVHKMMTCFDEDLPSSFRHHIQLPAEIWYIQNERSVQMKIDEIKVKIEEFREALYRAVRIQT